MATTIVHPKNAPSTCSRVSRRKGRLDELTLVCTCIVAAHQRSVAQSRSGDEEESDETKRQHQTSSEDAAETYTLIHLPAGFAATVSKPATLSATPGPSMARLD